jgi:hypothetical protein
LDQKDEEEVTTQEIIQEKSKTPKETPEKPQRSDSRCPKETALTSLVGPSYGFVFLGKNCQN